MCCRDTRAPPKEAAAFTVASRVCPLGQPREERIQPACFSSRRASQERGCVVLCYAEAAATAAVHSGEIKVPAVPLAP